METYDAIVIGSGHNALITAAYLARAGWGVLVLEKNDRPGGLVRTDELTLPGFRHDTFSSGHAFLLAGAAYADLGPALAERGLRYLSTPYSTGVSFPDGRTAVYPATVEELIGEAERLAPGDGMALVGLLGEIGPYAGDILGLFNRELTSPEAGAVLDRLLAREPNGGLSPLLALLFSTARTVVSRFQSPVLQAMIVPWTMHAGRAPDEVGGGLWAALFSAALLGGGQGLPEGGSERLAQALARLITDHGGTIRTDSLVTGIVVEDGRAVAVRTAGEEFRASRAVVASVNPDQLYLRLLPEEAAPPKLREQASRFRYGRGCVQIHLALSEPPRWPDERFAGVLQPHLTDGLDGCSLAVAQATAGLLPATPTFTVDSLFAVDPSRAPEGCATMRIQVLDVPCRPRGDAAGTIDVGDGTWTPDLTARFTERILAIVGQHIPNIPSAVLGQATITPDTLAAFSPNLGPGDPYGGAHDLAQSYFLRPLQGQPGHRTAVPNLYMLGAATWPGQGISGGSGYIVAQQLLADPA